MFLSKSANLLNSGGIWGVHNFGGIPICIHFVSFCFQLWIFGTQVAVLSIWTAQMSSCHDPHWRHEKSFSFSFLEATAGVPYLPEPGSLPSWATPILAILLQQVCWNRSVLFGIKKAFFSRVTSLRPLNCQNWAHEIIDPWMWSLKAFQTHKRQQVVPHQVERDIEQLEYLVARGTVTCCRCFERKNDM